MGNKGLHEKGLKQEGLHESLQEGRTGENKEYRAPTLVLIPHWESAFGSFGFGAGCFFVKSPELLLALFLRVGIDTPPESTTFAFVYYTKKYYKTKAYKKIYKQAYEGITRSKAYTRRRRFTQAKKELKHKRKSSSTRRRNRA